MAVPRTEGSSSLREKLLATLAEVKQDKYRSNRAISTGSIFLDMMINPRQPGLKCGKITTVAGLPGSGKTSLALSTIRALLEANRDLPEEEKSLAIFFDVENGVDDNQLLLYGLTKYNTPNFHYKCVNDGNKILTTLEQVIVAHQGSSNTVFIAVDSIPHLTYLGKDEEVIDYSSNEVVAQGPNKLRAWFKRNKARLANTNIHLMFMTFLTNNVAAHGPGAQKWNVTGGMYLKYGTDILMELKPYGSPRELEFPRPSDDTNKGPEVGKVVVENYRDIVMSFMKQKLSQPSDIRYTLCLVKEDGGNRAGILDLNLFMEYAIKTGIIKAAGAWYSFDFGGEEVKAQGKKALKEIFKEAARQARANKGKTYEHPYKDLHKLLAEEVHKKILEQKKITIE